MKRWAHLISFVIGAAAALVLLAGWRVPSGRGVLGTDVTLSAARSPDVTLSQTGPFADVSALRPGESGVFGSLRVANSSGRPLVMRARLRGDTDDLESVLFVELRAGDERLYRGPLAGLDAWSRSFNLGTGASRPLTVRGWLPRAVRAGYQGRILFATLELRRSQEGAA
ncbi:MAG: hypothetical protein ABR583_08775 [Gaiellaceae bacterium]